MLHLFFDFPQAEKPTDFQFSINAINFSILQMDIDSSGIDQFKTGVGLFHSLGFVGVYPRGIKCEIYATPKPNDELLI